VSSETRREDNTIKSTISFCSPQDTVIIREATSEPKQNLARLQDENPIVEKHLPRQIDFSELEFDGALPKPKPSARQRKILINLLGNPFTPESEWLNICQMLGHETRIPRRKPLRRRTLRAFALALIVAPLTYALGTHLEKSFVKSVSPTIAAFNTSWDQYQDNMQMEISRSWIPSPYAENEIVSLIFKVNEDGTTGPIRLGRSSRGSQGWQSDLFRRSCVKAVLNARLNPLPLGLAGQEVECFFHRHNSTPPSLDRISYGDNDRLISYAGFEPVSIVVSK
jgi:hypothetical protein